MYDLSLGTGIWGFFFVALYHGSVPRPTTLSLSTSSRSYHLVFLSFIGLLFGGPLFSQNTVLKTR